MHAKDLPKKDSGYYMGNNEFVELKRMNIFNFKKQKSNNLYIVSTKPLLFSAKCDHGVLYQNVKNVQNFKAN